jgi:hypothetical protein
MRRRLLVALVLVFVPACAQGGEITADAVGVQCPAGGGEGYRQLSDFLAADRVVGNLRWLKIERRLQLVQVDTQSSGGPRPRHTVQLRDAARLNGKAPPPKLVMDDRVFEEARSELDRGAALVVPEDEALPAEIVAALRKDGSVVFLGVCAWERYTTPFNAFVDKRHAAGDPRVAAELFQAMASDNALLADFVALDDPDPVPPNYWDDVPAETRILDPEGGTPPPAAVMVDLRAHMLHFQYPGSWRDFDGAIATFIPGVGWNPVLPLSISGDDPAIHAYASLTKPLEVWAMPSSGKVQERLVRLAVVDPQGLATRGDVYLKARITAESFEDLVSKARAGEGVFELSTA